MDLVTVGALPDDQGTPLPAPAAITAFIDEAERVARKAGYRFKLILPPQRHAAAVGADRAWRAEAAAVCPPAPFAPPGWTLRGGARPLDQAPWSCHVNHPVLNTLQRLRALRRPSHPAKAGCLASLGLLAMLCPAAAQPTPPASPPDAVRREITALMTQTSQLMAQQSALLTAVASAIHPGQRDDRMPRQPTALDHAVMDDDAVLHWTVEAVLASYSFNYHDYEQQRAAAKARFAASGWDSSQDDAGPVSMDVQTARRARLLCFARADRPALLRGTRVTGGVLAYDVEFPVLQTCGNSQQERTTRFTVTANVVRTDAPDHLDGIAIGQLAARQD